MIHPATRLVYLNDEVGYGVVATELIPAGTITYVKDAMEIVLEAGHRLHRDPEYNSVIEKFSYTESNGTKVLSWDHAKYINHSCNYNTLSTGYGFEIAIRDIQPGEEITDDYGLFNIESEMSCLCGAENCRTKIGRDEFLLNAHQWDKDVMESLTRLDQVSQPLYNILTEEIKALLYTYLTSKKLYQSVSCLELQYMKDVAVS